MLYKIKEFYDDCLGSNKEYAIDKANEWLEKNSRKIEPISVSKTQRYGEYAIGTITILYKEI